MLAASDRVAAEEALAPVAPGNAKKRRRRENSRARGEANARGELTAAQLYLLYCSDHTVWHRMSEWLSRVKANPRRPDRKDVLRQGWTAELEMFRESFKEQRKGCQEDYGLFVSVASSALLKPPDEESARRLWSIVDSKGLAGTEVGSVHVPIGMENVGARMLVAMGWRQGEGLGRDGWGGILEPIPVGVRAARNKAGVGFKRGRSENPGLA